MILELWERIDSMSKMGIWKGWGKDSFIKFWEDILELLALRILIQLMGNLPWLQQVLIEVRIIWRVEAVQEDNKFIKMWDLKLILPIIDSHKECFGHPVEEMIAPKEQEVKISRLRMIDFYQLSWTWRAQIFLMNPPLHSWKLLFWMKI
jgi:hypothetical protein